MSPEMTNLDFIPPCAAELCEAFSTLPECIDRLKSGAERVGFFYVGGQQQIRRFAHKNPNLSNTKHIENRRTRGEKAGSAPPFADRRIAAPQERSRK